MLKDFFLRHRATLVRFPSAGFIYGFIALVALHFLLSTDLLAPPPRSTAAAKVPFLVVHIEIILLFLFAFVVGIGESLIGALRDIRRELVRLQPSPPEEPK